MQHFSLIKRYFLYIILFILSIILGIYYTLPQLKKIIPSRSIVVEKQSNVDQLQMQVDEIKKRNEILKDRGRHLDRQVYKPEYNTTSPIVALSSVMEDITKFLEFNNLRIISINYTENPLEDIMVQNDPIKYNVCSIDLSLVGTYNNLQGFLKDIFKYPYLLNIVKLEVTPYYADKTLLIINIKINLYSSK